MRRLIEYFILRLSMHIEGVFKSRGILVAHAGHKSVQGITNASEKRVRTGLRSIGRNQSFKTSRGLIS